MPWKAQVCAFCKKRYANKTGLRTHLSWFVGEWRLPSDGVHDVLKIAPILRRLCPPSIDEEDDQFQYRCWTCSKVFKSRWRFQEHAIYRRHCQEVPRPVDNAPPKKRARGLRAWQLPFDEELVLIKQETFPFLKLPFDLRVMIYDLLLRFEDVSIGVLTRRAFVEPRSNGVILQHNPDKNALAIMSTNRQVYNEARSVFYRLNTFTFLSIRNLSVFLMGIGPGNAMLVRKLMCETECTPKRNLASEVQSCVVRGTASKGASKDAEEAELTWDLKLLTAKLSTPDAVLDSEMPVNFDCFVRPSDTDDSCKWQHFRHGFSFILRNGQEQKKTRSGTVTYELCALYELCAAWRD